LRLRLIEKDLLNEEFENFHRIKGWINQSLNQIMKIVEEPHVSSIREGLDSASKIMIIFSIFSILLYFPLNPSDNFVTYFEIQRIMPLLYFIGFGVFNVWVGIETAYSLAKKKMVNPLLPSIMVLIIFLLTTIDKRWLDVPNILYFGGVGLITSIIVAILCVEVYAFCVTVELGQEPSNESITSSSHILALIALVLVISCFWIYENVFIFDPIRSLVPLLQPLEFIFNTLPIVLLSEFIHIFFWFFGIHGDMITDTFLRYIWFLLFSENFAAKTSGLPLPNIYCGNFRSYITAGGSGCTLMLAVYCASLAKSKRLRKVGKTALKPGIFNINEFMLFGVPIANNPIMFIPFILVTLIAAGGTQQLMEMRLISRSWTILPWNTPVPLLVFLGDGYNLMNVVWSLTTMFIIPGILYYPFFKRWDQKELNREEKEHN